MPLAEELQERGRAGVLNVKRWLEATVRFEFPYDVYTNTRRTELLLLNDAIKRFDLMGQHYDERRESAKMIYVEVKTAETDSNLSSQWREFLANAYSATHRAWVSEDPEIAFMFASTHAWSSSLYWTLTEREYVLEACNAKPELMPDGGPDPARIDALVDRLFLWVIPRRQDDMTMSRTFRGHVLSAIEREADS